MYIVIEVESSNTEEVTDVLMADTITILETTLPYMWDNVFVRQVFPEYDNDNNPVLYPAK